MKSMKTWSSRSAVGRVFVVLSLALVPFACGQTDENAAGTAGGGSGGASGGGAAGKPTGTGGSRAGETSSAGTAPADGGSPPEVPGVVPGTSDTPKTIQCGGEACKSTSTLLPNVFVDPCCADEACGTSTEVLTLVGASFADTCQPRAQKGERTDECPSSAPRTLDVRGMKVTASGFAGCCRAETGTCGVIVNDIQSGFISFAKPGLGCVDSAPFFEQEPGAPCGASGAGGAPAGGAPSSGGAADGGVSGAP